jgi:hypothetical protein
MGFPHVYPDPACGNHAEAPMNCLFGVSGAAGVPVFFSLA